MLSRRSLVAAVVFGAAVAGLAGCVDEPASSGAPATPGAGATPRASATAGPPPQRPGAGPAWTEPAAYGFVLDSSCGERALIGRFRVAVNAGRVIRVDPLDEPAERAVQIREGELVPTLGQLMAEVRTAEEDGADVARTDVDPGDGHPTAVRIDRDANSTDDELCYAISEYTIAAAATASR